MAIIDFLTKQFIDIIEWTDDSRDTLSYRFPDEDKEIKNGAQLIVRESQLAQFVYLGEFGDTFGPGKHTLTTDNIPILTNLKSWKYALQSPFKADVYYVVTRVFTGNKWGTANPVMMRDADFGIVRLRAYGTYDFRVSDAKKFLKEVAGTDNHFRLDEFADAMRSRLVSVFSDALAQSKIPALDVAARYGELGEALLPLINPVIGDKYGLAMTSFIVENVSVPPDVEQAIDKRSSMAAVGNLNDYVKFQMAQGLEKGGGGIGGAGAELAMGMAMAQQMMNQTGGLMAQSTPGIAPPPPVAGGPAADLMNPAQVAQMLGVAESDVLASLDAGDLKGKKIGTQWRVTRSAVDSFLEVVMRRGFLFAILALAIAASLPSHAQDARATEAQRVAREWLVLADKQDGAATWTAAGPKFQAAMSTEQWSRALRQARGPLGAVLQRAMLTTQFAKNIPGQPDGEYVLLQFRTSFEKKESARETLTLERVDGKWRVIGYFIR